MVRYHIYNKYFKYIGNISSASDAENLKKNNITSILTVAEGIKLKYPQEIYNHKIFPADDVSEFNLA